MKNKGFTLVELIVVIALIVILGGLIVPSVYSAFAVRTSDSEYARAAYYSMQKLLTEQNTAGIYPNEYVLYYIETNVNGIAVFSYISGENKAAVAAGTPVTGSVDTASYYYKTGERLASYFNVSADEGYFYIVADNKGRVEAAYYSPFCNFANADSAGFTFTADSYIENFRFGSYPTANVLKDLSIV